MIRTVDGAYAPHLIRRVMASPERFRRLVICSPFIDERMQDALSELAMVAKRHRLSVCVITRPYTAKQLSVRIGSASAGDGFVIKAVLTLHAKVFVALGRLPHLTRAVVSSANLTKAGATGSVELGVAASPMSDSGGLIVGQVLGFLESIRARAVAHPAPSQSLRSA